MRTAAPRWRTVGVLVVFTVAHAFGLLGPSAVGVSLLTAALVLMRRSAAGGCFTNSGCRSCC
jgi:non-ribosomal peptide synthetase component E (peptide arylation enzyme)